MECMICGSQISGESKPQKIFSFIDGITDFLRRKFGIDASDLKLGVINSIKNQIKIRENRAICKRCVFDMMQTFSPESMEKEVVKIRNRYFSI